jgi:hypothetical protein
MTLPDFFIYSMPHSFLREILSDKLKTLSKNFYIVLAFYFLYVILRIETVGG